MFLMLFHGALKNFPTNHKDIEMSVKQGPAFKEGILGKCLVKLTAHALLNHNDNLSPTGMKSIPFMLIVDHRSNPV